MFISYRREDTSGFAGRLYEALGRHFGEERIFRDIEKIQAGADFAEMIHRSLQACGAFVVVIGRDWLVDSRGRRRLDDPEDWVHQEVAAALARDDVSVFPVLVEGAGMPSVDELPAPLVALARSNAIELSDSRWAFDVTRLITDLEAVVGPRERPGRAQRWLVPRSLTGIVGRVAVVLAVLAAGTALAATRRPSGPVRMRGEFNVAVAGFRSVGGDGRPTSSEEARDLEQQLYGSLDEALATIRQSGLRLELRSPDQTGPLGGDSPESRADHAGDLAERINADIVVSGTLALEVPTRFTTEFFLSDRRLANAPEILGQHELGSALRAPGDVTRNAAASSRLRQQVLERTRALSEFVAGLSFYASNQFQSAQGHFEAARAAPGWQDGAGREVLYLFLGNVAGKLRDYQAADGFYDQALSLNPDYRRARLGKAEVLYQRSRGDCEAGSADPSGLTGALDLFQASRGSQDEASAADIDTKIAYGSARIFLCLSQAQAGDRWADAEREFQNVISEFRGGNERVREMAAESYAGVGFVHLPAEGDQHSADRFRKAAESYRIAADLTLRDERKAFFLSMQGFAFAALGDRERSSEAYRQAVELEPDPERRARYEEAGRRASTGP